ncbi:MAG TPA: nucleoside/nucleotide kinase family protein, partial [Catenuloplanes sp.]
MLLDDLVERAGTLAGRGSRSILGIAGPPGSGKSTLAAQLTAALGARAVLVPM